MSIKGKSNEIKTEGKVKGKGNIGRERDGRNNNNKDRRINVNRESVLKCLKKIIKQKKDKLDNCERVFFTQYDVDAMLGITTDKDKSDKVFWLLYELEESGIVVKQKACDKKYEFIKINFS